MQRGIMSQRWRPTCDMSVESRLHKMILRWSGVFEAYPTGAFRQLIWPVRTRTAAQANMGITFRKFPSLRQQCRDEILFRQRTGIRRRRFCGVYITSILQRQQSFPLILVLLIRRIKRHDLTSCILKEKLEVFHNEVCLYNVNDQ